ncbi:MAG: hypothetical protein LBF74_11280 [Treponema sp.]|jgi:hypothetical protein|nr:hypothetical protein [Treponema sp.]
MQEIIIPELTAGFFIAVSLSRLFIRKLRNLEGLAWLPVLALGVIIALFPAYGFRPECIPLLIYGIACAFFNMPVLVSLLTRSRNTGFKEHGPVFQALMPFLLLPVLGLAVFFAPVSDSALLEAGVTSAVIWDEERGVELFLRIYGAYDDEGNVPQGKRQKPILVLIPPLNGSVPAIDVLCGKLRDAGFTTVAYSRRGFDSPAVGPRGEKYPLPPNRRARLFRAESRGRATVASNEIGRSLEEERRRDIQFLLGFLRQNTPPAASGTPDAVIADALAGSDRPTVFLAGYDAGGAALLELAGSPDFAAQYPAVKGLIAVESPLLSVLREETPPVPPPHDNRFIALWLRIRSRAVALLPRRISGIGEVPHPAVPVCFILSDRAMESRHRNDRYATILKVLHSTKMPTILAAAAGAGPLDYSDIPEKYPLYRVFRPGSKWSQSLSRGAHGPEETAALMTNFASAILALGAEGTAPVLSRIPLSPQNFHIETNNGWNSLKKGSIL